MFYNFKKAQQKSVVACHINITACANQVMPLSSLYVLKTLISFARRNVYVSLYLQDNLCILDSVRFYFSGRERRNAQMYGSGNDILGVGQSRLYEILNYQTASPTIHVIGNMGASVGDLAVSDTGVVYATSTNVGNIRTVNVTTGALGPIVISGIGADVNALAWAPGNLLYTYGYQSGVVKKIDLNTNSITTLLTLPTAGADLAFDPTDDSLYAASLNSNLYKINPVNGTFSLQGKLVLAGEQAPAIAIDSTGQMYAMPSTQSASTLGYYSVNKANAQSSLIADFTNARIGNLGLTVSVTGPAPVPEPGNVALLVGMVLSGTGFLVRRRKQARKAT